MRTLRPTFTTLGGLVALAAITLGMSLTVPAEATVSEPAHRTAAINTDASLHTLMAGHALVAGTTDSTLSNGWYSLNVWSGTVEIDETIPVAGSQGLDSSTTGTWFRTDPTGRFQPSHDHTRLRLGTHGDLSLITSAGRRLWHTGTRGSGAVRLTLHRRGNLALHTSSGTVVWSTHTGQVQMSGGMRLEPGHQLRDGWETAFPHGKRQTLTMQRNGDLVHRCGSRIDWQSHTPTSRPRRCGCIATAPCGSSPRTGARRGRREAGATTTMPTSTASAWRSSPTASTSSGTPI